MKKAKIMLVGITVLAITGGAFALKAQKFGKQVVLGNSCNTNVTPNKCNLNITYSPSTITTVGGVEYDNFVSSAIGCQSDADCTVSTFFLTVEQ